VAASQELDAIRDIKARLGKTHELEGEGGKTPSDQMAGPGAHLKEESGKEVGRSNIPSQSHCGGKEVYRLSCFEGLRGAHAANDGEENEPHTRTSAEGTEHAK
jgi:hypothetical protein